MIGKVLTMNKSELAGVEVRTKWIIFDTWGDFDEYYCVTDLETQTIDELIMHNDPKIISIEDFKVEWLFIARREKNLKTLEGLVR